MQRLADAKTAQERVKNLCAGPQRLNLALLGAFSAADGQGKPIAISAKKNRALLAILALAPNLTASRERIARLLWGDRSDDQARKSLRQSLAVLRKELGEFGNSLLTRDDIVGLSAEAVVADASDFLKLAGASDAELLRRAAGLYRGELFADVGIRDRGFEEWIRSERDRFRQTAIRVLERLVALEAGPARIEAGLRLVELDPLREVSHRVLMQAYADTGDRGLAIKQYDACKTLLRDELDVEPAAETQELAKRIASGQARQTPPGPRLAGRLPPSYGSWPTTPPRLSRGLGASLTSSSGMHP